MVAAYSSDQAGKSSSTGSACMYYYGMGLFPKEMENSELWNESFHKILAAETELFSLSQEF